MSTLDAPMRSVLFVPATQRKWARKASKWGADAVVIDLEDSVPIDMAEEARSEIVSTVQACRDGGQNIVAVRPNELHLEGVADLEEAAKADVDFFFLPKATVDIVRLADRVLEVAGSGAALLATLESPEGIVESREIAQSSDRIIGLFGGGARYGDTHRLIGYDWTPEATETLYIRSRIVLHARAAGLTHIIGGAWIDLDDPDGRDANLQAYRSVGYTGYVAIHPSQIDPIHTIFSPSQEEVAYAERVLDAMEEARRLGVGAVRLDGQMVDIATARAAEEILRHAGRP